MFNSINTKNKEDVMTFIDNSNGSQSKQDFDTSELNRNTFHQTLVDEKKEKKESVSYDEVIHALTHAPLFLK